MTTPEGELLAPTREQWFQKLRARFVEITRRRVPPGHVEDIVQDALSVVHEKHIQPVTERRVDGLPTLAWCFQVLRNTIGNHYQKEHRRSALDQLVTGDSTIGTPAATPLEAIEFSEVVDVVQTAIDELAVNDTTCAHYMRRVLEDTSPAAIAEEANVTAAVIHRRLYRCRAKLRSILVAKGVRA